ncbi:hypothetical protein NT6N_37160 [Oceaniferula spumae]|uniref:FAD-dependent oxidoreductase n=1 Tax=Oceaniferula spumae TaxID=2979115 RepID=A0AAT9FRQ3_9BACT
MKFSWLAALLSLAPVLHAGEILVEAETFQNKGGWKTDTQFIESMGSPYLLAHGLGTPVADASTTFQSEEAGTFKVWVRTKNWTKALKREGAAGTFNVSVNGKQSDETLGNADASWSWQPAGSTEIKKGANTIQLHDLTGFDGRVDAIIFSNEEGFTPPNDSTPMAAWRAKLLNHPETPVLKDDYDLVVIGGGYGGLGAAISASRMGAKVALIQNRPVLGGNGSSEIQVWAMGNLPPSEYKFSDIIREIEDKAKASPATKEQFVDDKKLKVVMAEKNIDLFLSHHAYGVTMKGDEIDEVKVFDVNTAEPKRFKGKYYVDCTGHGFIGLWAKAAYVMAEKGRMGMSNMWTWKTTDKPVSFPDEKWMLPLTEKQFPYPRHHHAQWFWEGGFDNHPIDELEKTRDNNLLASYSAWNAIKNHGAYKNRTTGEPKKHTHAKMTWLAYIGGTRETLQLLGDVVLSDKDIEAKKEFPDGCVLTTWSIDLHVPHPIYTKYNPENPFISKDIHRHSVDRKVGYPIPYRCFYSKNIPNLFMAGRNISVTREALGTIRVMKTIGMMGVAVGRAAALGSALDASPRELYADHLETLKAAWRLEGKARFESPEAAVKSLKQ